MELIKSPRLKTVDRLNDGLVVKFDDNTCFFYSASLLFAFSPEAKPLDDAKALW